MTRHFPVAVSTLSDKNTIAARETRFSARRVLEVIVALRGKTASATAAAHPTVTKKVDFNGRMRLRRAGNRSDLARTVRKALVLVDADLSEGRPRIASPAFSNRRYAQNWISAVNGACSRVIAPSRRCSMEERGHFDWRGVNLGAIPFLAVAGAVIVLFAMWRRPMSLRGT